MKNLLKSIIPLLFISHIFAIVGFGVYGDYDLLKHDGATSSNDIGLSIETIPFENAYGIGGYLYIDALPIIDIELSVESVGNLHETIFTKVLIFRENYILTKCPKQNEISVIFSDLLFF